MEWVNNLRVAECNADIQVPASSSRSKVASELQHLQVYGKLKYLLTKLLQLLGLVLLDVLV